MKKANIPIFVAHLGCPNDCVFCNQRRITGTDGVMTGEKCEKIINEWLSHISGEAEIAFFGGSFTGIPLNRQNELLRVAAAYLDGKKITGIRLSTRPDYISEEIIENLLSFGVTTVELGAQSTSDDVLALSHRGHTAKDIEKASEMILASGMELGLQMMTHLPGSDDEKDRKTCRDFIRLGPSQVRIYPTLVLKDTCLCDMYCRGEYSPQTLEEAVLLTAELTEEFEGAGIRVIRIGLQPSESLDSSFVAGPYHPAFGEMAKSRQIYLKIKKYVETEKPDYLVVEVEKSMRSKLSGQKRANILLISALMNGCFRICEGPPGSGIKLNGERIY